MVEGSDSNPEILKSNRVFAKQLEGRVGRTETGIYLLKPETEPTAEVHTEVPFTNVRAVCGELVKVYLTVGEEDKVLNAQLHNGALKK
jgi:hypothetical protein